MTAPKPDPFAGAPCRSPEHTAWIREHRASQWDYYIDGETKDQSIARRRRSVGICFSCPARQACREKQEQLDASGIWGGRVFPDKPEHLAEQSGDIYGEERAA
ncbi:WhiB family transcriptional regulator [Nocardia rhizosphaerae]|uniref:WhiB family transcriptional regulator n=1 Tax=Nocardia rhizosphaerae TaxID=1691571 RepID=A0ABV8LF55_9NOCA